MAPKMALRGFKLYLNPKNKGLGGFRGCGVVLVWGLCWSPVWECLKVLLAPGPAHLQVLGHNLQLGHWAGNEPQEGSAFPTP